MFSESTIISNDFAFQIVETDNEITVSICQADEYYNDTSSLFYLVDIYKKEVGHTAEEIKEMLSDTRFVLYAVTCMTEDIIFKSKCNSSMNEKINESKKKIEESADKVPIYEKMNLTLDEAAKVTGIGKHTIERMIRDYNSPSLPFSFTIGTKTLIKKKLFEKFLEDAEAF